MDSRAQDSVQGNEIAVKELSHERRYFFRNDPAITNIRTAVQRKKIPMDKHKYIASMEADDTVPVLLRILLEIEDQLGAIMPPHELNDPTKATVKKAIEMFAESDYNMRTLRQASTLELPGLLLTLNEKIDGTKIRSELDQIKLMTKEIVVEAATCELWKEACHYMRGLYRRRADDSDLDACRDQNGYPQKLHGEYPTKGIVDKYFFSKTKMTKMDVCDAYKDFAENIEARIAIYQDLVKQASEVEGQNDAGIPARLRVTKHERTLQFTAEVGEDQLPALQRIVNHARQLSINPLLKTQCEYFTSADDVRIKMFESALTQNYKLLDSQSRVLRNFISEASLALDSYLATCKHNYSAKAFVPDALLPDVLNNTHTQVCRETKVKLVAEGVDIHKALLIIIDLWRHLTNKKSKTLLPEIHKILMDSLNILFPPHERIDSSVKSAVSPDHHAIATLNANLKFVGLSGEREEYYKFNNNMSEYRKDKKAQTENSDLSLPAAVQALLEIGEKYAALEAVVESNAENAGSEVVALDRKIAMMNQTKTFLTQAASILGELDGFDSRFKALGMTDISLRKDLGEEIAGDRIEQSLKHLMAASSLIAITPENSEQWKEVVSLLKAIYANALSKSKCKLLNGEPQKQDGHYPFVTINKGDQFFFEKTKLTKVDIGIYCKTLAGNLERVIASCEDKVKKIHSAESIPCCVRLVRKANDKYQLVVETSNDNEMFLTNVHDFSRALFSNPFIETMSQHRDSKDDIRLKNLKSLVEDDERFLLAFDAVKLCNFRKEAECLLDAYINSAVVPSGYRMGIFDNTYQALCESAKRDLMGAKGDVKLELLIISNLASTLAAKKSKTFLAEVRKLLIDAVNMLCPVDVRPVQGDRHANVEKGRSFGFGYH